jgi:hypothetical protein
MEKLEELWTEDDLIERYKLRSTKEVVPGEPRRSREITSWVLKGLKCIRLGKIRYFREEDIVAFFDKAAKPVG